jgi:hypothetical protein
VYMTIINNEITKDINNKKCFLFNIGKYLIDWIPILIHRKITHLFICKNTKLKMFKMFDMFNMCDIFNMCNISDIFDISDISNISNIDPPVI